MNGIPEVLQFSIVVKGRRVLSFDPQFLKKLDFLFCRIAVHRQVLKEFRESWLFLRQGWLAFDKLKSRGTPRKKSAI